MQLLPRSVSLSRFEAHAGSSYRRSAANIFLEDGRSLLECQMQVIRDITRKDFKKESCSRKKSSKHHYENDYICSVCHYGGDLVLCDQCPSSFHKSCLGLMSFPFSLLSCFLFLEYYREFLRCYSSSFFIYFIHPFLASLDTS